MPDDAPLCLYGDDVRIRQIIMNLLGNAIKFTEEGYVRLNVGITDASVIFEVSDTGSGIKPEGMPLLFEAFEQTDVQKNRYLTGTGLGLTIAKALIDMMEGTITVESQYGEGTTFRVSIPKVLGDETMLHKTGGDEMVIYAPDAKILVVDDNKVNLNVSSGLLGLYKITVESALSGSQAIELLKINQYDLIFMDHMMPEMDGIEATALIRQMGIQTPIVALTANAIIGVKETFLAAGMNDLLTKPIKKDALSQVLFNWLPREKLKVSSGEPDDEGTSMPDEKKIFWEKIRQINELSVQTGLDRVSGQYDVYEKSLKLTIREIEKCCSVLNSFLEKGDMQNFRIEIHSIKSSLANTGAMELSSQASEIERAAAAETADFCISALPRFLAELKGLAVKLTEAFTRQGGTPGTFRALPELFPYLKKILEAIEKLDFVRIDTELKNLDSLNLADGLDEFIERIKDAVLLMDYDSVVQLIHESMAQEAP